MSIPLFPSLQPNVNLPVWCELDPPIDEEAEIVELEREQREWKASFNHMYSDAAPIGKSSLDQDEDDLDDMGDDEDETGSSDMDDGDDDPHPGMFRIHDNLSPPHEIDRGSSHGHSRTASRRPTPFPHTEDTSSSSSTSSGSSMGATHRPEPLNPQSPTVRSIGIPTRVIVGRHIPAPRPGMPQEPVRVAYIDTTGRSVHRGHSAGSVSPTSRAYIDAALQSPPGLIHLDLPDEENNSDNETPDISAPAPPQHTSHSTGTVPGRTSDYHRMIVTGQIYPSVSSVQIDNLIESMHQAQRDHAARQEAAATQDDRPTVITEPRSPNEGTTPSESVGIGPSNNNQK